MAEIEEKIIDSTVSEIQNIFSITASNLANQFYSASTLKEKYEVLQNTRQFISSEILKYRIGVKINVDGEERTIVLEMTGNALDKYISGQTRLDLSFERLQSDLQHYINAEEKNNNSVFSQLLEKDIILDENAGRFYDSMLKQLQDKGLIISSGATRSSYYVVKEIKGKKIEYRKNAEKQNAKYNLGTIFENIERIYLEEGITNVDDKAIEKFIFRFKHDSTPGTIQGDTKRTINNVVTQFQQKINKATIMRDEQISNKFLALQSALSNVSINKTTIGEMLGIKITDETEKALNELSEKFVEKQLIK